MQFVSNRCQGGGSDQNVLEIKKKRKKYKIARGTTDPGYHMDRHIEFRKYKFAFFSKLSCHHNYSLVGLVWPNTEELISGRLYNYGFTKDPIAAPGPYENQECWTLVGIAPAPTLFTTSTKHHRFR